MARVVLRVVVDARVLDEQDEKAGEEESGGASYIADGVTGVRRT